MKKIEFNSEKFIEIIKSQPKTLREVNGLTQKVLLSFASLKSY